MRRRCIDEVRRIPRQERSELSPEAGPTGHLPDQRPGRVSAGKVRHRQIVPADPNILECPDQKALAWSHNAQALHPRGKPSEEVEKNLLSAAADRGVVHDQQSQLGPRHDESPAKEA